MAAGVHHSRRHVIYPPSSCTTAANFTPVAMTVEDLRLAHWPEVVRKMAAQLRGLVEGVLKKKAATPVEGHDGAEARTQAASENDLTP